MSTQSQYATKQVVGSFSKSQLKISLPIQLPKQSGGPSPPSSPPVSPPPVVPPSISQSFSLHTEEPSSQVTNSSAQPQPKSTLPSQSHAPVS